MALPTEGPGPAPAPVVLAHVSDLHLGAHVPSVVEGLVADVTAVAPTLTVVTGDHTMRARSWQLRDARALLDRLPAPLLVVLGNHDVPLAPWTRVWAPYAGYRALIEPELDPVVRLPGVWGVGLESMPRWRWKSGRVRRRQARELPAAFAGAPEQAVRIVALHHPPSATGLERIAGRSRLARALVAAQVDLVLAGHTHVPADRRVRLAAGAGSHDLVEVVAGTATSTRTRGTPRSWSVIRLDAGSTTVEHRVEDGGEWHASASVAYPRSTTPGPP